MSDLISRSALYAEIAEKEELARKRVLDTPTNSPCYMRYVAQLNERTAFKHMVADTPTIEAVPVVEVNKIIDEFYSEVLNFEDYIEPISESNCTLLYSGRDITKMICEIRKKMGGK